MTKFLREKLEIGFNILHPSVVDTFEKEYRGIEIVVVVVVLFLHEKVQP